MFWKKENRDIEKYTMYATNNKISTAILKTEMGN